MPKRTNGLTDANARLHKNHSYELLVATRSINSGWQVFVPLLDAAHAVDLIAADITADLEAAMKQFATIAEDLKKQTIYANNSLTSP